MIDAVVLENSTMDWLKDQSCRAYYSTYTSMTCHPPYLESTYLNNKLALMELHVMFDGVKLKHNFEPVYLGVKLDRSLTYGKHIDKLRLKLATRINLLRKLAGTSWVQQHRFCEQLLWHYCTRARNIAAHPGLIVHTQRKWMLNSISQ